MPYTLEEMVSDCRNALKVDSGPAGRHAVRKCIEKACLDEGFVSKYLGPDNDRQMQILHEDNGPGFSISVHVAGPSTGPPHGHGASWAIYGVASGTIEMTDWLCLEKPVGRQSGKVAKVKSYEVPPGVAHLYNEGDLHSSRRLNEVRMIRLESTDSLNVAHLQYEAVESAT